MIKEDIMANNDVKKITLEALKEMCDDLKKQPSAINLSSDEFSDIFDLTCDQFLKDKNSDFKTLFNNNLNNYLMNKELPIYQKWLKLDPETKKLILHKFIRQIEISRDEEYFIDITNIKFEKQYFDKNADEFLNDLMLSLREDYKEFEYKQIKDMETLLTLYENYNSISVEDYLNNNHNIHDAFKEQINNLVANQGVLVGAIILDNKFVDEVLFIPKMP